jgi:transcriptional regulator with XRE-family HTH domain
MSRVRAINDIRTAKGLLVAQQGRFGVAVLNTRGKLNSDNFGKVPVRWNGRQKLYWSLKEELEFINPTVDPELYVARPPEQTHPIMPTAPRSFEYDYGHNLRHFRRLRKMKQWQLAEGVSKVLKHPVSQTTVSYWERNASPPRGAYVNAVAVVLNVPAFIFMLNMDDCFWLEEATEYVRRLTERTCEEEPF